MSGGLYHAVSLEQKAYRSLAKLLFISLIAHGAPHWIHLGESAAGLFSFLLLAGRLEVQVVF